jgi:hypothetical protein
MVFSMACSSPDRLGTAIVAPLTGECQRQVDVLEEARRLWAAESNNDGHESIGSNWGRVCFLSRHSDDELRDTLASWSVAIRSASPAYRTPPHAFTEEEVLDRMTGRMRFAWPTDVRTGELLEDFDLLLATATEPTLSSGEYEPVRAIAEAWRNNPRQANYFYNNRANDIVTFEDERILRALKGDAVSDSALA